MDPEKLKSIIVARIERWDAKLHGPHDRGVYKDEESYRAWCRGRLHEAQALLDLVDQLANGKDVSWATPS
jgi:hypothetical protein